MFAVLTDTRLEEKPRGRAVLAVAGRIRNSIFSRGSARSINRASTLGQCSTRCRRDS